MVEPMPPAAGAPPDSRPGPLAGVRVVDMATVVAGPGAARLFADFGAEVIKVEPPAGDPVRRLGWLPPPGDATSDGDGLDSDVGRDKSGSDVDSGERPGDSDGAGEDRSSGDDSGSGGGPGDGDGAGEGRGAGGGAGSDAEGDADSYFWKLHGRNKRVAVLDLKTTAGLDAMLSLIDGADLLVENLRPGKLEALGLGPDVLHERNPRLVILRVTGFGQEGPYASRPGFATLAEALSGYAAISGEPGGRPLLPPVAITDELTGTLGAFGALAALWEARRSGKGQVVDISLVEAIMSVMGPLPSAYAHLGYQQPRLGAGIPYSVPRGTYQCADGAWVALSASSDTVAARVLDLLGAGDDERFATFAGRFENREALEALMTDWIAQRPATEVIAAFEQADAAIAPVYTMADLFADEHFAQRGLFTTVDGVVMQAVAPRLSRTPGHINFAGRPLGADTAQILAELHPLPPAEADLPAAANEPHEPEAADDTDAPAADDPDTLDTAQEGVRG